MDKKVTSSEFGLRLGGRKLDVTRYPYLVTLDNGRCLRTAMSRSAKPIFMPNVLKVYERKWMPFIDLVCFYFRDRNRSFLRRYVCLMAGWIVWDYLGFSRRMVLGTN